VAVCPCGPGGGPLADRLQRALDGWVSAGQPSACELRLRVYPGDSTGDPGPGVTELRKPHSRLLLDWPSARVAPS
jgi:hypothetical protein